MFLHNLNFFILVPYFKFMEDFYPKLITPGSVSTLLCFICKESLWMTPPTSKFYCSINLQGADRGNTLSQFSEYLVAMN